LFASKRNPNGLPDPKNNFDYVVKNCVVKIDPITEATTAFIRGNGNELIEFIKNGRARRLREGALTDKSFVKIVANVRVWIGF
jgi:hypothetical protein